MQRNLFDDLARPVALLAASLLVLAAAAGAAPPPEPAIGGWIELGALRSTENDYEFGKYTGLTDEWNPLANFQVGGRAPWDSGDTWHFLLQGQSLGLPSRWARGEGGLQGLFDLHFDWIQIPHLYTEDAWTPFLGRGTDFLTLPANWVPSDTTWGFTSLYQDLNRLRLEKDRSDIHAGGRLVLPAGFEWVTNYHYDRQLGSKPIGSVFGYNGGNPRSAIVPETIDWRTNDVDTSLRWAGEHAQVQVGYEYSHFADDSDSLTWQNPYSFLAWPPAASYPAYGRRSLAPDNSFHQVTASSGYDLPYHTRITGHVALGWMLQNDNFLPYTDNPGLIVHTPLPASNADGKIATRDGGIRITSSPIDKLHLKGEWRYDQLDDDTPRRTFVYIGGDSQNQPQASDPFSDYADKARIDLPYGYRTNQGTVQASYEVYRRTEVLAGYQYEAKDLSWTETDHMHENTFNVGLHSKAIRQADFRVDASWGWRNRGDYFYQAPVVRSYVDPAQSFDNNPLLRKFNLTGRQRTEVSSRLMLMPIEKVTIGGNVGYSLDQYDGSALGLRGRAALSFGFDASWNPTEWLTVFAFFQDQAFDSDQRGLSFSDNTYPTSDAFNQNNIWRQDEQDRVQTVGGGVETQLFDDRLTLRADAAWSRSKVQIDLQTNSAPPPAASLPDTTDHLLDLGFQAEYKVVEHVRTRFGYLFQYQDVNDWAYDNVQPNTISSVLTLGTLNPHYYAHLFSMSVIFDF